MSETIDMSAALTAAEIKVRCEAIAALIGGSAANCTVLINGASSGPTALVTHSSGSDGYEHFSAPTFGAVLDAAEKFAANFAPLRKEKAVRKLALDIIDLTDQHGSCTVAMLRGRQHSQVDIDAYKDAACVRAGELAGNAPFAVVS
jgi:hypothetical protein